jgi:hypothetical protein
MGFRNHLMSLDRRVLRGNYPLQTNDETTTSTSPGLRTAGTA